MAGYGRAEHERDRARIEASFGGLHDETRLCSVQADFDFGGFVDATRNADIVVAFHASTPEWWIIEGQSFLEAIIADGTTRPGRIVKVIVANLETVELLAALVTALKERDGGPGSYPALFAKKLIELSVRGEVH